MTLEITVDEHNMFVLLHQTTDLLVKCEEAVCSKIGITREKYTVLMSIKFFNELEDNHIIISNLAYRLNRSINSMSTIIDRMEKESLVEKERSFNDRRAIHLAITKKAEKMLKKISKPHMVLIHRLFSIFTGEEPGTLIYLLEKLKTREDEELGRKKNKADLELGNYSKMLHFLVGLNNKN